METFTITPRRSSALASVVGLGALVVLSVFATNVASASSALGPTNTQREARARSEVRHLLATAPLPPGAQRESAASPTYRSVLGRVQGLPEDRDHADAAEFFTAPHGAAASAWLNRLRVNGTAHTGTGSSSGPGTFDATFVTFSFPATSLLRQPQVEYTMIMTPTGALDVRVDAEVLWTPRKSLFSQVATDATRMVVVSSRARGTSTTPTTGAHAYRQHDIERLIASINALPAVEPGLFACPRYDGATMTFRFYDASSTRPYAVVTAESGGCGIVTIDQYHASGKLLGTTRVSGGTPFVAFAATLLDLTSPAGTTLPS